MGSGIKAAVFAMLVPLGISGLILMLFTAG